MKRSTMIAVSAAIALLAPRLDAKERMARCYLGVDGKAYLDDACIFNGDTDGSFSIGTAGVKGTPRMPFFAYVNKRPDGSADGYWNEDASSTHAQAPLGVLKRAGACWANTHAKVCAY